MSDFFFDQDSFGGPGIQDQRSQIEGFVVKNLQGIARIERGTLILKGQSQSEGQ